MMWKIEVTQTKVYKHSKNTYTDSIGGMFKTADEAVQFAKMVMKGFKDCKVEITYTESNIEEKEEEEEE